MMQAAWWPGGGTDYGGCVGRHVAYDTSGPSHNILDAGAPNAIVFNPGVSVIDRNYQVAGDRAKVRWGIFGQVNVSVSFADIRDGNIQYHYDRRITADHSRQRRLRRQQF